MVSFRKAFLLLALVVAFTTVAGAATATCQAFTSNVPNVRAEGIAEEVGQVVIECKGGDSSATRSLLQTINVQVFLSVAVTSRRTSTSSSVPLESMLILDEATPAQTSVARTCVVGAICNAYADGLGSPAGYRSGMDAAAGTGFNVFQGRLISSNSIIWTGVPFDAPGTGNPIRTMRLVNIRANASQLGTPTAGLLPSAIQMFISISGTAAPNLTGSQLYVAYSQDGLKFSSPDSGASYLQCEPADGATAKTFRLRFQENFPTAFRRTQEGLQNDLKLIYNTEGMYIDDDVISAVAFDAGRATQGTRLMAILSGVPDKVILQVPSKVTSTDGTDEATYQQCFDVPATGLTCNNALLPSGSTQTLTVTGGQAVVVYEITKSNPITQWQLNIPLTVRYGPAGSGSTAIPGPPGTGTVSMFGSYAPTSTVTSAVASPAPRFLPENTDTANFKIEPCRTNLLFPYVTNQGGFDTGLVVANTSLDKFGTIPQSGTCTVEFYGKTGDSGAAPGDVVTESIPAGGQLVASLAAGGNYGMPKAEKFQGYIIARCNFQYAHGYAVLYTMAPSGSIQTIGNYLALVLDASKDAVYTGTLNLTDLTISLSAGTTRTKSKSEVNAH